MDRPSLAYFFLATIEDLRCVCGNRLKKEAVFCSSCWRSLPLKYRKLLNQTANDEDRWFGVYQESLEWVIPVISGRSK
jgi:hypothetical protein